MNELSTPTENTASPLDQLVGKRKITPAHVVALRASELGLGIRTIAEAEAMFALERSGAVKCRAWGDFLVETMLDFLVWDERPAGQLSDARAIWLGDQVGERPTPACMALLVAILEEASDVPAWFPQAVRVRAAQVFTAAHDTSRHLAA